MDKFYQTKLFRQILEVEMMSGKQLAIYPTIICGVMKNVHVYFQISHITVNHARKWMRKEEKKYKSWRIATTF